MDFLEGLVERITYYNAENGYTVLRLSARGHADLVSVVGNLPEISPGESLRLHGQWITNTQYGKQFKAERCEQILPATIEGIKKYLGSGLIKGVGPVTAQRIVKRFGAETLDVLDRSPEQIRGVLGIGPKRAALIGRAWEEQKSIKQVMVFLQGHGVNTGLAVKIYKQYGDAAIDLVQADPYRLAHDIYGIGFKTADKIAHDLGLPHDSPSRVAAGVVYTLSTLTDQGHVFAPQNKLIHDAAELLTVTPEQVTASFATLEQSEQIKRDVIYLTKDERRQAESSVKDEAAIYLTPFYQGEVNVAKRLNTIIGSPQARLADLRLIDFQTELNALGATVSNRPTARLSDQQREAVKTAITHKVTVLTGGPGTGKCVSGDTLVMTADGLIPISDLMPVDSMQPDSTRPISVRVQSRAGFRTAAYFYYGGYQATRRLATAEGFTLEGTPNHRVIVATEHGPAWQSLDHIQSGDYVAIFRPTPCYDFVPEPFAYFLGLFTGDGNADRRGARPTTGVIITSADPEIWSFLEDELPPLTFTVNHKSDSGQARCYYIGRRRGCGSGGVAAVMREWGCQLLTSRHKTIPTKILRGTPSQKHSFLMGLFDSDGTADKRDGTVELGMSNYSLLKTVQIMLLEFGIIAILREKPRVRSWRLTCRGENARLFYERIGFKIERKQARRTCLSSQPNTNLDIVPQLDTGLLRTYIAQTGEHERRWWWKWKREVKGERKPHRDRVLALL
ncbi:partial ATP-dependent RecD-like DNA helicase, partial [Anaerolineae bacterium]